METLTIFALVLFAATYVLMFLFQKARPYVAMLSAAVFVVVGSLPIFPQFSYTWADALGQIDWNVIMMIAGTMGTVYLFIESKMPQLLGDIIISKVHSVKWLIVTMSLFAGIISAFVDNVATVLMVAPVAMAVCKTLKIPPFQPSSASRCPPISRAPPHWWGTPRPFCWARPPTWIL